jgi:NADH-quinone oxidoreductase subunit G
MTTIHVDNRAYQVSPGQNLLAACLGLGLDLPYFCWHPALGSVGACRQCAVIQYKNPDDLKGRLVMSCLTPADEGTRIAIEDPRAVEFRASVIEGMMQSHPHDCPVCDEGGHCHLQDMTVMTGHVYRRYEYRKRTFRNQNLGPFVNHEMNRCIQCYRCVRFYREYAGEYDLNAYLMRELVFFGRSQDGVLRSEFAGNLIEVCPTGVFTDKTLKAHYTRKWDLRMAPSVCVHCGLGCNITPGERYGMLRAIDNRYNGSVNGYFLCDRGRFGYEFVNHAERIRQPLLRRDGSQSAVTPERANEHLRSLLGPGKTVIGIGSPRASLESNYALRTLVGADRFFSGMSERDGQLARLMLHILRAGPAHIASMGDAERADAVLVLGEDVMNTAPRLALALRQSVRQGPMAIARAKGVPLWHDDAVRNAVQDNCGPLYIATPDATRLDGIATATIRLAPDDIARLGFAVAHALDSAAPAVPDLAPNLDAMAIDIARALREAERPLIVSGAGCATEAIVQAAANVAWALTRTNPNAALTFAVPECNTMGLTLTGAPSLQAALHSIGEGAVETVIVLENDLTRRSDAALIAEILAKAKHLVVLDSLANATTTVAELVLPVGTFAEASGTFVNNESRAQRFFQVFVPDDPIMESWRWLVPAGHGAMAEWKNLDDVVNAMARELPALAAVAAAAPESDFRMAGSKIPREPHRYSGRTAILANIDVNEPQPPDDPDSPLSYTMEGNPDQPPGALIPFFWSPGWNSIQATNKFQSEIAGPLKGGDPGVRLVEPAAGSSPSYYTTIPARFSRRPDAWLAVPLHHIFGSEELSARAPAVRQLFPAPYIAVNPDDAHALGAGPGQSVRISWNETLVELPLKLAPALPAGVVGLPVGLPDFPAPALPAWAVLSGPA